MQNKKLFGVVSISSSQDPTKIAVTVQGLIISVSALIIYGAWQFFGVTLVTEQVSAFAVQAGLAVGALVTLWGFGRKVLSWFSW